MRYVRATCRQPLPASPACRGAGARVFARCTFLPPGRFPKLERDQPQMAMRPLQSTADSPRRRTQRTRFSSQARKPGRVSRPTGDNPTPLERKRPDAIPLQGFAGQPLAGATVRPRRANPQNNPPRRVDSRQAARHCPPNDPHPPGGDGRNGHTFDPLRKRAGPPTKGSRAAEGATALESLRHPGPQRR